jgi:hypothetical protein
MTHYLVTVWRGPEMVRELWSEVQECGRLKSSAEVYALRLAREYSEFEYTVRPVTDQELQEVMTA